jgi:hypothetical protein
MYLYNTFKKEKEARNFVGYLKRNNKNLNEITFDQCEQEFMYLCGAFDQYDSNKDRED